MNNFEKDIDELQKKILALLSGLKLGDNYDRNAFQKIAHLERKPAIGILRSILNHPEAEFRIWASEVLMRLDAKSSQKFVLPLLKDSDVNVRYNVAELLSNFGDSRSLDSLIEVLITDSNADVRYSSIIALGAIGDERAIPTLKRAAENDFGRDFQGDTVSSTAKKAIDWILNS